LKIYFSKRKMMGTIRGIFFLCSAGISLVNAAKIHGGHEDHYVDHSYHNYQYKCTIQNITTYVETCVPTFKTKCDPVKLPGIDVTYKPKKFKVHLPKCYVDHDDIQKHALEVGSIKLRTNKDGHPDLQVIPTKCQTVKFNPEITADRIVKNTANICLKSYSYGGVSYDAYGKPIYGGHEKDQYETDYKCYDQKHKVTYNEPVPQPDDVDCSVEVPVLIEHVKPHIVETPTFKCDQTHETEILIMIPTPVQGTIHANRCTVEVDEKNPACSLIPLTIPQQVCHPPYEAKTVYVPVIPDPYKHDHSAHIVV